MLEPIKKLVRQIPSTVATLVKTTLIVGPVTGAFWLGLPDLQTEEIAAIVLLEVGIIAAVYFVHKASK